MLPCWLAGVHWALTGVCLRRPAPTHRLDERDLCAILGPIDMLCALMSIAWTCVMSLHVGILLAAVRTVVCLPLARV